MFTFKRVEGLDLHRDFIVNPLESDNVKCRIWIAVTLYQISDTPANWLVIRDHYEVDYTTGEVVMTDTIEDAHEEYTDLREAFDAFSVQCVKAFTQQVVWYNRKDKEAK